MPFSRKDSFDYMVLLAMLLGADLHAQSENRVITTGVPFLLITPDARAAGMGELGVATSADAYAQQWNPAKYAFLREERQAIGVELYPLP